MKLGLAAGFLLLGVMPLVTTAADALLWLQLPATEPPKRLRKSSQQSAPLAATGFTFVRSAQIPIFWMCNLITDSCPVSAYRLPWSR